VPIFGAAQLEVCLLHQCNYCHIQKECCRCTVLLLWISFQSGFHEWTPKNVFNYEDCSDIISYFRNTVRFVVFMMATMKNAVFCSLLCHVALLCSVLQLLVTINVPSSLILVTLMMEVIRSTETSVLNKSYKAWHSRRRHSSFLETVHIWDLHRAQRLFHFIRTPATLGICNQVNETLGVTVELKILSQVTNFFKQIFSFLA
jgi:hypothetical protein